MFPRRLQFNFRKNIVMDLDALSADISKAFDDLRGIDDSIEALNSKERLLSYLSVFLECILQMLLSQLS